MIRPVFHVLASLLLLGGVAHGQEMRFPKDYFGRSDLPLPESKIHLEKLLDESDNFEDIDRFSQNNRYRRIASPVGRLDLLIESHGEQAVSVCTAWVISPEHLMTNYHCIPGHEGTVLEALLVMNFLAVGQDESEIDFYEVETGPVEANRDLDYAVVRVLGNPAERHGRVSLSVRDPEESEELFVIHHPAGKPKKITRRNCRNAKIASDSDFHHYCDTLGGSSGSPIFSDNDLTLVGLHYAGLERQYNMAKRLQQIVAQSALLRELAETSSGGDGRPSTRASAAAPATDPKPAVTPPGSEDDAIGGDAKESGWGAITD